MPLSETFDVAVVGGGPAGATAATDLARQGHAVLLLDRAGRIKPCGGAIPPRLIRDFDIPPSELVARITAARMVAPSDRAVDMPVGNGFVGMVDRERFDPFLRARAGSAGADCRDGTLEDLSRDGDGLMRFAYRPTGAPTAQPPKTVRARVVIGADGAVSTVARAALPAKDRVPFVFAYHEIVATPPEGIDPARCDVYYQGPLSPDFYAWIFPHGPTISVGTGSARKGFALKDAVARLRARTGLDRSATLRREGAPIPLHPRKRWDDGHGVLVCGDAAGVVAPASGEGIYYAMASARLAAEAADTALRTGQSGALTQARRAFMAEHGRVFAVLGLMQAVWYRNDWLRERFVSLCRDPDIQRLTWEAYMNKALVRAGPMAHLRIAAKDLAHLFGFVSPWRKSA